MKTIKIVFSISLTIFLVMSCEDYSADTPQVKSLNLTEQALAANDRVTANFVLEAEAEKVVVWWGEPDSDYDTYLAIVSNPSGEENTTRDHPQGDAYNTRTSWDGTTPISHTYDVEGTYEVVVIATCLGDFGDDIKTAILRQTFTIELP